MADPVLLAVALFLAVVVVAAAVVYSRWPRSRTPGRRRDDRPGDYSTTAWTGDGGASYGDDHRDSGSGGWSGGSDGGSDGGGGSGGD